MLMVGCFCLVRLTEGRVVGHEDVDALRYEVPFIKQGLSPRQVKAPAIKPGGPEGENKTHTHA